MAHLFPPLSPDANASIFSRAKLEHIVFSLGMKNVDIAMNTIIQMKWFLSLIICNIL